MLHTDGMSWRLLFVALVTVAFTLLLGGLAYPARADLLVSDLGNNEVRKFDDTGIPISPIPFIGGGGGGEGLACLKVGTVSELLVANNGSTINVYDPTSGAFLRQFASGLGQVAALSLSPDGSVLYAADYGNQRIDGFRTVDGSLAYSMSTSASHDVRVGPDGSVYAADFRPSFHTGVRKFAANLLTSSTFIADGANGLMDPAGMTFDKSGNFWVSNFTSSHIDSAVYEYDPTGTFLRKISNDLTDLLFEPFGLDVGPDGNIYVAVFGSNIVTEINVTTNLPLSPPFIHTPNAGDRPKYLAFTENCCVVPEPSSMSLLLAGMLGMAGVTWRRLINAGGRDVRNRFRA